MKTTRLSTKGQVVLSMDIRSSRSWGPGTEFIVEETSDGILLRPAGLFPKTEIDQVAGCLQTKTRPKSLAQMRSAAKDQVIRRHDRGRY